MVIDDNPADIGIIKEVFKTCLSAVDITIATDGDVALHILEESGSGPDLVLLDMNMARVGGLEVLSAIRNNPRTRGIPVVVLTGGANPRDIDAAYGLQANAVFGKPMDFYEFSKLIHSICATFIRDFEFPQSVAHA